MKQNLFMKNFFILAISTIIFAINPTNNDAKANMFNKFKKGFYFEKYSEADRVRAEYYKMINYDKKLSDARNAISRKYGYDQYYYDLSNKEMIKELDNISILTKEDEKKIIILRNEKNYQDDAMTALLKLHPIGSDVNALIKTLEGAGAVEYDPYAAYNEMFNKSKKVPENYLYFKYKPIPKDSLLGLMSFFTNSDSIKYWNIDVKYDEGKILDVFIENYRGH